mmetsp:Transcript_73599/g.207240  ORF Transcript_73599/g.207240 Transcript_73599/m.207240 type:complete len:106 (-) Transcript_73599:26-343(-)
MNGAMPAPTLEHGIANAKHPGPQAALSMFAAAWGVLCRRARLPTQVGLPGKRGVPSMPRNRQSHASAPTDAVSRCGPMAAAQQRIAEAHTNKPHGSPRNSAAKGA